MANFLFIVSCFVFARDPSCFKTPLQVTPFFREGKCWPAVKGNAGSDKSWSVKLHRVLAQVPGGRSNKAGKGLHFPWKLWYPNRVSLSLP